MATGAITGAGVGALGALAGLDPTASRRAALIGALAGAGVEIAKNVGKKTKETVEEVLNAGKTAEKEDAKSPDIKKEAVTNKSTASKTASAKKPEKKKKHQRVLQRKKQGKGQVQRLVLVEVLAVAEVLVGLAAVQNLEEI